MAHNRRDFLVRTTCAALSAAAFQGTVRQFGLANLLAQDVVNSPNCSGGYKALVCVFLNGGNDGNNMVIPYDDAHYANYSASRPGLAIAKAGGVLDPTKLNDPASMGGRQFALHPSMLELKNLYNANKLAVVPNVGPLVEPMTQNDYINNLVPKPFALFSHSDQVQIWQSARADVKVATGWGGRVVDSVLSCNAGASFPTMTSISGSSTFCIGVQQRPLSIGTGNLNTVLVLNGFGSSATDMARRNSMDFLRTIDLTATTIAGTSGITQQGVDTSAAFASDPVITTVFPNTSLSNQLKQVAKIIKLNQSGGLIPALTRQIFFVSQGGYDTHQNQPGDQGNLFLDLSGAMNAFYNSTVELGLQNSITTFTLSDFGRTLQPSGTGTSIGTDHGWGNHQFVMGGSVLGGNFYGTPSPANGQIFPVLLPGSPDDTSSSPTNGRGRWIPATAVDEFGATLSKWLGVTAADIPSVFPLIGNFGSSDLGFMG